ncbi:DHHC palmitoyltransferase-domain-containing protein, partial [Terfezia claveryi]
MQSFSAASTKCRPDLLKLNSSPIRPHPNPTNNLQSATPPRLVSLAHHRSHMAITVTPLISRLLVVFVCILILSLAYPTQYVFLHPYNRLYAPWWTGLHTLWFNFCVLSIWISYARSVGTDPGGLPGGKDGVGLWVPDGADELGNGDKREEDVGRMKTGKLWGKGVGRWCKKCEAWKPPRCHHCRKCGRCVLRMDHHCGCIFSLVFFYFLWAWKRREHRG